MATPEGKVKGWLDKMFKEEGVCYFAPQAGPYGSSGVEDRIAIVCGLYLGVEVKADASKKMTAKQELRRAKVLEADGWHFLVYDKQTIEEVREFIQYVRACNSRQEGISGVIPRPRYYLEGNTKRATCAGEPSPNSPWTRGNDGTWEFGIRCTAADPLLLYFPGAFPSDGPPANNSSLPDRPQEMYSSE